MHSFFAPLDKFRIVIKIDQSRSTFIENGCVMWGNHLSVIDNAGEKNKRRSPLLSVSDRNDPRRTPTKSASTITKITATIRIGAVVGTRLIYLLSNVPTSPSTLFTSPSGWTRGTQKGGYHIRSWDQWILSTRDLLRRFFRRDVEVTVKTPLSVWRSTHQPPLCHPDRGAQGRVYETDRKKCKLRERI